MKAATRDTRPSADVVAERGLHSRQRVDHPGATEPGRPVCWIARPHGQHAYGKLHPAGGLAHWCNGVEDPALAADFDPTGGR